ncbi:MAG: hypothetical protein ACKVWV_09895 [Planctomycetota bacterium]
MQLIKKLIPAAALTALCVVFASPAPTAAPVEIGGQQQMCWKTRSAPCLECEGFNSYYCEPKRTGYKKCTPDFYDCSEPEGGICATYWLLLTECP